MGTTIAYKSKEFSVSELKEKLEKILDSMSQSSEKIASKDSTMLVRSEEARQFLLAEAKSLSCRKLEKA